MFKAIVDLLEKYRQANAFSLNVAQQTIIIQRDKIKQLECSLNECYELLGDLGQQFDK